MLCKSPNERISTEDALKHEWFNQADAEINDEKLDFAEAIDEDED
mgnify:CR=1 FL=1